MLALLLALLAPAHADTLDCVTADGEWRYVRGKCVEPGPRRVTRVQQVIFRKRVIEDVTLVSHGSGAKPGAPGRLEVIWDPDTVVPLAAWNDGPYRIGTYRQVGTIRATDGEEVVAGLGPEVRLELICHDKRETVPRP